MKKTNITITFEDEKLKAARMFLSQKGLDLEAELNEHALSLYEKHVPKGVREFIDMKGQAAEKKPKHRADSSAGSGKGGAG
ncbi:MAG: DUF6103 family protein [Clostridiales Family XIII bacterium]|jgi:hypothetical protein|nr:DUF6103 family protein [Clostridiales Family XIII bacterium]